MTTQELEAKLEGGAETQSLDIKAACDWNVEPMAKHILAMSNVQDGGYIIVGIQDGTFERQGITPIQKTTYKLDTMRDQMAPFADPHVKFTVEFPHDGGGLEYAVIHVLPFDEVPVICGKTTNHTSKGVVYYRNNDGRVQSGPVSNSYDMRDIITTATIKMMQRMREKGLTLLPQQPTEVDRARKALQDERKGL